MLASSGGGGAGGGAPVQHGDEAEVVPKAQKEQEKKSFPFVSLSVQVSALSSSSGAFDSPTTLRRDEKQQQMIRDVIFCFSVVQFFLSSSFFRR